MPLSQEVGSGTNHKLSVTGDDRTLSAPSHSCGPAGHPIDLVVPEPVLRIGSEKNRHFWIITLKISPRCFINQGRPILAGMCPPPPYSSANKDTSATYSKKKKHG